MKKIKLKFLSFVLSGVLIINAIFLSVPVYADEYTDAFWEVVFDLLVVAGSSYTSLTSFLSGDFEQAMKAFYLGWDKYTSGLSFEEWLRKNFKKSDSGEIDVSEELMKFLQDFMEYYATEHPEEVEKINYRIIHTISYDEAFYNYSDYRNALDGIVHVPEGSNSLDYWKEKWNTQTQYESFPSMILISTYPRKNSPENVQDLSLSQSFSFFEGYEKGKSTCLIGEFGGNGWGASHEYHIGVYNYDSVAGSLSIDRRITGFEQSCHFIWDADNLIWNGTENWAYLFSSSGNAYINMSGSYWGGGWGYYAQKNDAEYSKRYGAVYNSDKSVTIPVLATPSGSTFRLFATEQDALKYYETCANSNLNFDPNQVYTGGSITINNNGDVTINNNPPDGGDDNPTDSTGWLEKIYNRLGDILTQVKQIKWLTVADVVLDALDSFGGGIGNIASALVDALSQVFPLCILWDFVKIVELFEAEPVPPVFEVPIKFGWLDETITIDLTEYEDIFTMLRFGEVALFLIGLFNITMSWVGKGDEVV